MKNKLGEEINGIELKLSSEPYYSIIINDDGTSEKFIDGDSNELLEKANYEIVAQLENGEDKHIGTIYGYILNAGLELSDEVFDVIGGDIFDLAETFAYETMEPFVIDGSVDASFFYLETITINENYRNIGVGSLIMEHIETALKTTIYKNKQDDLCGIILFAQPIHDNEVNLSAKEKTNYRRTKEFKNNAVRLKKFYNKNGFMDAEIEKPSKYMYKCF